MLDSRRLQAFQAVVEHGSYSAAARALGYTQPAISQQMRALERSVGTTLFRRIGRGVQLTEAGEVLLRHATQILQAMSSAQEQVAAIKRLQSGRVRLCTFPSASPTVAAEAIALLAAEHPGIRVELVETEPPNSVSALLRGECDLTLAFNYPGMPDPAETHGDEVRAFPLLSDPVLAVLPKNHFLARRQSVRMRDLSEERWIAGCPQCRQHLVHACAAAGFEPDIAFTTDDTLAVQSLVATGSGIALMPGLVLSFLRHPKIVGRRVKPSIPRQVTVYTLRDYVDVPATALLLDKLRDVAGAPGGRPTG